MGNYDAVVVGAGPSGLTAAYCLAKHGAHATVVERAPNVGGLMRGVKRGDFHLDLGRKVLNPRFPVVQEFWTQLLGPDYRPYDQRVGVLYGKQVLEMRSEYKGPLRGLTWSQVARIAASSLWSQIKPGTRQVRNMEDFYVLRNGRAFFEYFVYGFMRKFTGCEPNQLPAPASVTEMPRFAVLRREQNSAGSAPAQTRVKWLHPARGTQQIVDALLRGADAGRIEFQLNTEVSALNVKEGDKRLDAHVLSCYYCLP